METRLYTVSKVVLNHATRKNPEAVQGEDLTDDDSDSSDDDDEDRSGDASLTGYAIMFNSDSEDLGGFIEQVAPGALDKSLADADNIYALWSHDWSQPLGSTTGGKLKLSVDTKGLAFSLDTKRFTPLMLDAAQDGELRMSFGFQVNSETWTERDGDLPLRILNDVTLMEVSPVTLPAYPDTSAALRSFEAWKRSKQTEAPVVTDKYPRAQRIASLKKLIDRKMNRS